MKYTIYTKSNCSYCNSAKNMLKSKNIEFEEIHIPTDISREEVLEIFPDVKTVPIIIIDGKYIGGFTELQQIIQG